MQLPDPVAVSQQQRDNRQHDRQDSRHNVDGDAVLESLKGVEQKSERCRNRPRQQTQYQESRVNRRIVVTLK